MMTEPGVPYPQIPVREDQVVIRIENKTEAFQAKYGIGLDDLRQRLQAAVPKATDSSLHCGMPKSKIGIPSMPGKI